VLCVCGVHSAAPSLPGWVATMTDSPHVFLWNTKEQPSREVKDGVQPSIPDLTYVARRVASLNRESHTKRVLCSAHTDWLGTATLRSMQFRYPVRPRGSLLAPALVLWVSGTSVVPPAPLRRRRQHRLVRVDVTALGDHPVGRPT